MTMILLISVLLIIFATILYKSFNPDNDKKILKAILQGVFFFMMVVLFALMVAKIIELVPDHHGEFGDWLGYWGEIFGGIVSAIVAAVISYFVTTTTYSSLKRQQRVDESEFEIKISNRRDLIKKFRALETTVKEIDLGLKNFYKLISEYKVNESHSEKETSTFLKQLDQNYLNSIKKQSEKVNKLMDQINKSEDFEVILKIGRDSDSFGRILFRFELDALALIFYSPLENSFERGDFNEESQENSIEAEVSRLEKEYPEQDALMGSYNKIIKILTDVSQY